MSKEWLIVIVDDDPKVRPRVVKTISSPQQIRVSTPGWGLMHRSDYLTVARFEPNGPVSGAWMFFIDEEF